MPNDLKVRIHSADPRLKRHIDHDSRSADYRLDTSGLSLVDVDWSMHILTLDQGRIGKCTAEAACEVLASDPFWSSLTADEQAALGDVWTNSFYNDEQNLDGDGPFPPNDNGSTGLTSAKVAKARGLISGYEHTFTAADALKGLQLRPFSWGTLWKQGMSDVDESTGLIKYTGATLGGHEICAYKLDVANELLWCRQSWGQWGYQRSGVFCISFADFDRSLGDQGDVTFFTPLNVPAPTPVPPTAGHTVTFTDAQFSAVTDWADHEHVWHKATVAADAWKEATA